MDAWRDRCQNLVWYGAAGCGKVFDGGIFAEYLYAVAYFCVGSCDIDHAQVHTDIADGRAMFAVDDKRAATAAEVAVNAVGIAYGYRSYDRRRFDLSAT